MHYFKKTILLFAATANISQAQQTHINEIQESVNALNQTLMNLLWPIFVLIGLTVISKIVILLHWETQDTPEKTPVSEEESESVAQQLQKIYDNKSQYLAKNIQIEYSKLFTRIQDIEGHDLLQKDSDLYKNYENIIFNLITSLNNLNSRIVQKIEQELLHSVEEANAYSDKFLTHLDEEIIKDIKISTKHSHSISSHK